MINCSLIFLLKGQFFLPETGGDMSTEPTKKLADELVLKKNPNPFPFLRGVNFGYLAKQAEAVVARWCAKR